MSRTTVENDDREPEDKFDYPQVMRAMRDATNSESVIQLRGDATLGDHTYVSPV